MKIIKKAQAGTMQSSDLMVFVEPSEGLTVQIESTVKKQFEHLIRSTIGAVLAAHGVTECMIRVTDRGALDYAIEARLEAALKRAGEE